MTRPLGIDLCCCAGGASKGYDDAGFEMVGIDIAPQPHYPYRFIQADAIAVMDDLLGGRRVEGIDLADVAMIHASPPCQHGSTMTNCRPGLAATYPQLVPPVRDRLKEWGGAWVIEQPERGTPLIDPVTMCCWAFGYETYRHRCFESSVLITPPPHRPHVTPASKAGHWKPGTFISVAGNCAPVAMARQVMQISWTTRDELSESIPPYFAQRIGEQIQEIL